MRRKGIHLPGRTTVVVLIAIVSAAGPGRCVGSSESPSPILNQSWAAYVGRFMQADGRVIDQKNGGISMSEGQAYTMLRAVWMQDRAVFDRTYTWALNNLNSGIRTDHLWAWKWGKDPAGKWQVLDRAFASDADQDVALALLMAYRTWNDERYLQQARATLADLWRLGTIEVGGRRYLLAGDSLCQGRLCRINPSYAAPYAYRIFAAYDGGRNWSALVDSSYVLLDRASALTSTHLPADWVLLDAATGALTASTEKDSAFSYDAFRVYWRIAADRELFGEARADRYLKHTLPWLTARWKATGTLPAVIASTGKPLATYESPEMLAALMSAWRPYEPLLATTIHEKLHARYKGGMWADESSYYVQNWVWFGTALYEGYLAPFAAVK
jgi:endo-1,4-beta-D-glucanase Y